MGAPGILLEAGPITSGAHVIMAIPTPMAALITSAVPTALEAHTASAAADSTAAGVATAAVASANTSDFLPGSRGRFACNEAKRPCFPLLFASRPAGFFYRRFARFLYGATLRMREPAWISLPDNGHIDGYLFIASFQEHFVIRTSLAQ